MPKDVSVVDFCKVDERFDARFSVKRKTYQYRFYVSRFTRPLYEKTALRVNDYVNLEKMKEACKYFIGTFDFESFVSKKSGKTDFVRTIYDAKIVDIGYGVYALEITGNGFLYNMVRIIFGTILKVGYNKLEPQDITKIISQKRRSEAGGTMPAYPLLLKKVDYDA